MINVSHWYGRLGNNIQQCAVGCMVSELLKNQFSLEIDHEIISKFQIKFGNDKSELSSKWFYWEGPYQEVNLPVEYINRNIRRICKEYIFKNLQVPNIPLLSDDTIVIHIRSGDIFDQVHNDGHQYTPNPLYFYNELIQNFDKAIIVTEPDTHNPIVQLLKENPKVTVQSKTVAEDFATLLAAKNLANSGVGTFCVAAALCSQNIENFYCTNLHITEHLNYNMLVDSDVNVHVMELDNYLKVGEWKNNDKQRNFILQYEM